MTKARIDEEMNRYRVQGTDFDAQVLPRVFFDDVAESCPDHGRKTLPSSKEGGRGEAEPA